MGTELSSVAGAGHSGFRKRRGDQYSALRQLSGLGFLAATGRSTPTACSFGTNAGIGSRWSDKYAAERCHAWIRHLSQSHALERGVYRDTDTLVIDHLAA